MSTDPTVKELLERNKQYAANASSLPFFSELSSVGLTPPHIVIRPSAQPPPTLRPPADPPAVTCADPRCVPEQFLGLRPAEAVIMRNMCGHAAPALNDILALDHFVGFTEIMVIHHTDCGSLAFTDEQVRSTLRTRRPEDESIDSMTFGTIVDLEQSVRDDLAVIKSSPFVREELANRSYGFIYDIKTGLVSPLKD
ncbi:MAG: hypothetical protein Q9161_004195 [Pseudevernia consocians]